MPVPYILERPSGRYVRYFLPKRLREATGKRFIVRKLPHNPDRARLLVGAIAVALSQATRLYERTGQMVDFNEALKRLRSGKVDELLLEGLTLPNGGKIERAQIDSEDDARLFSRAVEEIGRVAPDDPPQHPQNAHNGLPLADAIKGHISDLERQELASKTLTESRHTLKLFLGLVGNVPVDSLTVAHMREFLDEVKHYPRNASKRAEYQSLGVKQAIAKAKRNNEPEIANHTQRKHYSRLSVFLSSLVATGDIPRNPLTSLSLPKSKTGETDTGRAFTNDELRVIFGKAYLPWAKKYPHRFWGVLLGLYSGARVNEIAQLYKDDFQEVAGRWGFHINERHKDQRVKNKSSRRFVPVALPLIEAGFLDWLNTVQTPRIFQALPYGEGLGYGRQLSRQFSTYIKRHGIDEPHLGYHGFRHTFATLLDEAGATLEEIALITGHSDNKAPTVLSTFYVERTKSGKGLKVDDKVFLRACAVMDRFNPNVNFPTFQEWRHFKK